MINKKKILFVFCSQNFSGAEIVIERMLKKSKGFFPVILCPPGKFSVRLKNLEFHVIEEEGLKSLQIHKTKRSLFELVRQVIQRIWKVNKTLRRIIKEEKITIIHSNNLTASFYCLPSVLMSKPFKRKHLWVWTNQDLNYPYLSRGLFLAKVCHYLFDLTIAVSGAVKSQYPQYNPKTAILYSGLDPDEIQFAPEKRKTFRKKFNITDGMVVLGILGTISEEKGHLLVIEAFKKAIRDNPNIFLFIAGNMSPKMDEFNPKMKSALLGISPSNFHLGENYEDIVEIYSGIDILINATLRSRGEPLGTTIYEGMACKRVVLGSKTGGTPEIIDDGENGFLFEADDSNALYEKLTHILRNFKELDSIREKAREKVIEMFNSEKTAKNYLKLVGDLENKFLKQT